MVYYSKMSEEVGAVLCRGTTGNTRPQRGFLPGSAEAFARRGAGRANAEGEKGLLVPEPEKAAGVAQVLRLASGKHGVCTAPSVFRQLLPWVPLQGSPEDSLPSP